MNKQKEFIDYFTNRMIDYGVEAIYLKGSLAREIDDDYSDIDIYCIVTDEKYQQLLNDRSQLLHEFRTVKYESYVNFGHPQVIVIYDNNLHVDFYIATEVKMTGTEMIKSIYDPKEILKNYRKLQREDSTSEIIKHFSEAIYTFHELYIAIKRNDLLWSSRLASHILTDLSLVMNTMYDPEKPVLHMKGVYHYLPLEVKDMVDEIMNLMIPFKFDVCMEKLFQLIKFLIEKQSFEIQQKIDTTYLDFMVDYTRTERN